MEYGKTGKSILEGGTDKVNIRYDPTQTKMIVKGPETPFISEGSGGRLPSLARRAYLTKTGGIKVETTFLDDAIRTSKTALQKVGYAKDEINKIFGQKSETPKTTSNELPAKVEQMSKYYLKGFGSKLTVLKGYTEMYVKGQVEKAKVIEMFNKVKNDFNQLSINKVKGKVDFKELSQIKENLTTLEKEVKVILNTPTDKINLAKFKKTIGEINDLGHEYRLRLEKYTT